MAERAAIILAAGVSSRMNSDVPKVLHEVCGRPMLSYVLDACRGAGGGKLYVVVGFGAEEVKEKFEGADDIVWIYQAEPKGTAHAVMCCKEQLGGFDGETFVLCGDGPLVRAQSLKTILEKHEAEQSAVTMATAILDDPTGYGRICRNKDGKIEGIVEHGDCTSEQLGIKEVNPSYYLFNNKILFEAVEAVGCDNVKNEYYLTDAISIIISAGHKVVAVPAMRAEEAMSINTEAQLSRVSEFIRSRMEEEIKSKVNN